MAARTSFPKSDDDFVQARDLYRLMSEEEKTRLVDNIIDSMKPVKPEIQQ